MKAGAPSCGPFRKGNFLSKRREPGRRPAAQFRGAQARTPQAARTKAGVCCGSPAHRGDSPLCGLSHHSAGFAVARGPRRSGWASGQRNFPCPLWAGPCRKLVVHSVPLFVIVPAVCRPTRASGSVELWVSFGSPRFLL